MNDETVNEAVEITETAPVKKKRAPYGSKKAQIKPKRKQYTMRVQNTRPVDIEATAKDIAWNALRQLALTSHRPEVRVALVAYQMLRETK